MPRTVLHQKIAVIFPGALGDFICFMPALDQLRSRGKIHLFAQSVFAEIVHPDVHVESFERYEIRRLFAPNACCDQRVGGFLSAYSEVHSWLGGQTSLFMTQLRELASGRVYVYAFLPGESAAEIQHQSQFYQECVGLADEPLIAPEVHVPAAATTWCDHYLTANIQGDKPLLLMAPGSGAREKNWPAEKFAEVARWWRREIAGEVIVIIGPVEDERGGLGELGAVAQALRGASLGQIAALFRRATVYLGNDSGMSHLAAASGIRSLTIFGPTNPARWQPQGPRAKLLRQPIECSPCGLRAMKACGHRSCLTDFNVSAVIAQLARLPEVINLTRLEAGIRV